MSQLINAEAERGFLGGLIDGLTPPDYLNSVVPEDFHIARNRIVYQALKAMMADDVPIDALTVEHRVLRDPRAAEYNGWQEYLGGCMVASSEMHGAYALAEQLHELGRRRRMTREYLIGAQKAMDLTNPLPPEEAGPGQPGGQSRFAIRSAADALKPRPPLEWVVDNLVSRGSLSIFYGEPGSKKTYSLLWLAACAARGAEWLDFTTRACRVLFVDEESGETRLSARLAQVLHGALADDSTPIRYVSLAGLRLNDPGDAGQFCALIEQEQAELVIVDSLAAITSGDENSKQEVQPVMTALRSIAEQSGAAIVLIHHSGKNGIYRGSSAYKASTDLLVHVTSEDGSPYVNFKTEKNRDGVAMGWAAKAAWVEKDDPAESQFYMEAAMAQRRGKSPGENKMSPGKEHVLRHLEEHGDSPLPDIVAAADICSANAARLATFALAREGRIHRTNSDERGKGVAARYALCPVEESMCQ
jgi:hypothetical protein